MMRTNKLNYQILYRIPMIMSFRLEFQNMLNSLVYLKRLRVHFLKQIREDEVRNKIEQYLEAELSAKVGYKNCGDKLVFQDFATNPFFKQEENQVSILKTVKQMLDFENYQFNVEPKGVKAR